MASTLSTVRDRLDEIVDNSRNYREILEAVAGLANELSDEIDEPKNETT
jgi:hypothetical protein